MIPGFVDGIKEGVKDGWNWLTNKSSTDSSKKTSTETSDPETAPTDLNSISTASPIPEPIKRHNSLVGELLALKTEALAYATDKAQRVYTRLTATHTQNKELTELLSKITTKTEKDGSMKLSDDDTEFKTLLKKAQQQKIQVDVEKKKYSKDEVGKLVSQVELASRNLETDLKLGVNEVQESIHQRNLYFQELKSLWDKFFDAIKKIISAIVSR